MNKHGEPFAILGWTCDARLNDTVDTLSTGGATAGQVLMYDGNSVGWGDDATSAIASAQKAFAQSAAVIGLH